MYQRLEDLLESEDFEDDLKKLLEISYPNYMKLLEKRKIDIERSDHGIVIAGMSQRTFLHTHSRNTYLRLNVCNI